MRMIDTLEYLEQFHSSAGATCNVSTKSILAKSAFTLYSSLITPNSKLNYHEKPWNTKETYSTTHTGAGKLLLRIQVILVRTTANYATAPFKLQLVTAEIAWTATAGIAGIAQEQTNPGVVTEVPELHKSNNLDVPTVQEWVALLEYLRICHYILMVLNSLVATLVALLLVKTIIYMFRLSTTI